MSSADEKLQNLLAALDIVKQDYTCGHCSQMLVDPVTLSTCYHLICSSHFKSLTHCPTCKIPLRNCTTYKEDDIENCVSSARELDKIFERCERKKPTQPELNKPPENKKGKTNLKRPATKNELNSVVVSSSTSNINKGNEKKNKNGETALHIACGLGKIDYVMKLLEQGANPNLEDNAGWTPIHKVVQNGHYDLLKALIHNNVLINVTGQGKNTLLHEAIRYNHKEIAIELVKNGANPHMTDCKGETPMQLASNMLKKELQEAETEFIKLAAELYTELEADCDINVYCVSMFRTVYNKLTVLAKHHSNVHIELKLTKNVTHLIVDTDDNNVCTSSLAVLQGIVSGIWIISTNWITKSTLNELEPFENHEVKVSTKTRNGPKKSRLNKLKQRPGIFNGCHFYLHNHNAKYEISLTISLTEGLLTQLITAGGGVVLREAPKPEMIPVSEKLVPYHAKEGSKLFNCSHYIIFKETYEPMYNLSYIKALPVTWLIDCIEKYELCEPSLW